MKSINQIICIFTTLILLFTQGFLSPVLGMTLKEEKKLGKEFIKIARQRYQIITDQAIINYVNKIGNKILKVAPPQPFTYHFYVIKEDVYNAFAAPAGHVFINSGLFIAMTSEDELAGIIAHEISHVICRHISQQYEKSKKIGMATLAGVVAGIFLGAGGAATAASALAIGSIAAGETVALAYSREHEMQADQIGLRYMTLAGYNGKGLLTILKKIRGKQWFGSEQIPDYLTTHPAVEDRISYIDTWLQQKSSIIDQNSIKKQASYGLNQFKLARSRLLALYGDPLIALNDFESAVSRHPENPVANYGLGLTLARKGNRREAVVYMQKALEKMALDRVLLKDLGKIYFLDGNYKAAYSILESITGLMANDPDGLFYFARTQLALKKFKGAVNSFEKLIKLSPDYIRAYYFLGNTYGKLKNMGEAHYNLGIYYEKKGDQKTARFHLNRALKKMNDSAKKKIIEKMLAKKKTK